MGVHESHWVNGRRYKNLGVEKARGKRNRIYHRLRRMGFSWAAACRMRDWSDGHLRLMIDAHTASREEEKGE
jgi:hypothetical protein